MLLESSTRIKEKDKEKKKTKTPAHVVCMLIEIEKDGEVFLT